MSSTYRLFNGNGNKSIFISPKNAQNRLTLHVLTSPKKVNGVSLTNRRAEVRVSRQIDPRGPDCKDCTSVREPISVVMTISGSTSESTLMELASMRNDALMAINAAWDDLMVVGVAPTNVELPYNVPPQE